MSELMDKKLGRSSFLAKPESSSGATEKEFSRSLFLKGSGAVVVGLGAAGSAQAINAPNHPNPYKTGIIAPDPLSTSAIDSWLFVHPNNTVSIYHGRPEFGQGTPTAGVIAVADEM